MNTTVAPLTLRDSIISIVGDKVAALDKEFVDFHNDLRVATVRELQDLGITKEQAKTILYICDAYHNGTQADLNNEA
jgi:hypothetical protein